MIALFAFGGLLLLAVLLSELADRSILSISVLFLVAGFGLGAFGLLTFDPHDDTISRLVEYALFSVLFTDAMNLSVGDIHRVEWLAGRLLLLGMPLAIAGVAELAHLLTGVSWVVAFLIGAVLSPTDPVFAAAIVRRKEVPRLLRQVLNVESGVNDGFALPAVIIALSLLMPTERGLGGVLAELAGGVAVGVAVPYLAYQAVKYGRGSPTNLYKALYCFAIALMIAALSELIGVNLFLAAFSAGVTAASVSPEYVVAFRPLGRAISEVFKLAAIVAFGSLITFQMLGSTPFLVYLFALLILVVVRPLVVEAVLIGTELTWRERIVAGWFGPKGFASIFYGLLVLHTEGVQATYLTQVVAIAVLASILLHSSTDVVAARWLASAPEPLRRSKMAAQSHAGDASARSEAAHGRSRQQG